MLTPMLIFTGRPEPSALAVLVARRTLLTTNPGTAQVAVGEQRWPVTVRWAGHGVALLDFPASDPAFEGGMIRFGMLGDTGTWTPSSNSPPLRLHPLAGDGDRLLPRLDGAAVPLPGHPVYCGDLLTGLLLRPDGGPPTVATIEALARDPRFRTALEAATGRRLVVEPVALRTVLRPWTPPQPPDGPAQRLDPRHELVPFIPRPAVQEPLLAWCRSGAALSVAVLTGARGAGKTRAARQLAADLQPGWVVGALSETTPERRTALLRDVNRPLLLLVEHPTRQIPQLAGIIAALAENAGGHAVRILLVAREAGAWYERLRQTVGHAVFETEPIVVPPVPQGRLRQQLFDAALKAFDRPGDVTAPDLADPLSLHRAAMFDGATDGRAELVEGELRAWHHAADALGVPKDAHARQTVLLAALTCPPRTEREGRDLLDRLPGVRTGWIEEFARWLPVVLPPADPAAWHWSGPVLDTPLRDVLAALAARERQGPSVPRLLGRLDAAQAETALTLLFETADRDLLDLLGQLVPQFPQTLRPAALTVTASDRSGLQALAPLHANITDGTTDPDDLRRIAAQLPHHLGAIAPLARDVAERLAEHYRSTAEPGLGLPRALLLAARAQAALGNPDRAVGPAAEAQSHFTAALRGPDSVAARPGLVAALRLHAMLLISSGLVDDAAAKLHAAAEHCARLATALLAPERDGMLGELLEVATASLDQAPEEPDRALRMLQTARDLAILPPQAGPARHAEIWRLRGWALLLLGEDADARDAMSRAVRAYRDLEVGSPAAFRPALAAALDGHAAILSAGGDLPQAVVTGLEALHLQHQVAAQVPAARPALARMLLAQAARLAAGGNSPAALDRTLEARDLTGDLIQEDPGAHRQLQAAVANAMSLRLAERADWDMAEQRATEAVIAYRQLVVEQPAYEPLLAAATHNRAAILRRLARLDAAADEAGAAVGTWRQVARREPRRAPELAAALHQLGAIHAQAGAAADAYAVTSDAVDVYASLGPPARQVSVDEHVAALQTLRGIVAGRGDVHELIAVSDRIVDIRRTVGHRDGARFRRDLAEAIEDRVDLHRSQPAPDRLVLMPMLDELITLYQELGATDEHFADRLVLAQLARAEELARQGHHPEAVAAATALRDTPNPEHQSAALQLLAAEHAAAGHPVEAIAAAGELVDLRRRGGQDHLAAALLLLSRCCEGTQPDAALAAASEAVTITRRALHLRPEQRPSHVEALTRRAVCLVADGQREEAVMTLMEAVEQLTPLTADDPGYLLQLAQSSAWLAGLELSAGQHTKSLKHRQDAVDHFRELASASPDLRTRLTDELLQLADQLNGEEEHSRALKCTQEAAALARFDADRPRLIRALRMLAHDGPQLDWRRRKIRQDAAAELDQLRRE
ncbi:hypothetical protein [Dactylosporangium sp. NPDC005555]|uniref:P-loop NTPase n=1 Tax=Dactylosporangium sp. NPDC005555 TaxID=3154889 RepID=UPI0033A9A4A1